VLGAALAVAALVAALTLWLDVSGPFGGFASYLAGIGFGLARHALPLALGALAGVVLTGRRQELSRLGVGLFLVTTAVAGMLHLARHDGGGSSFDAWRRAGGLLGGMAATPLRAVGGAWAAGLVLAAAGALGILVVFHLSFHQVVSGLRRAGTVALRVLRLGLGRLTTLSTDKVEEAAPPAAKPKRVRRPKPAAEGDPTGEQAVPAVPVSGENLVLQAAAYKQEKGEAHQLELGLPASQQRWKLPPISVLTRRAAKPIDRRLIERGGAALEATLGEFGVDARLVGMTVGPTVTRYELELGPGVQVKKVTSLSHDIAYAMASPDVRIIAPIPGRSAIGVEVPNTQRQLVNLGDILDSEEVGKASHPLEVGLGRDIAGRACTINLATMPHLLIAGATGAGKSSCINSLITSILMRTTPEQVRMILVDPKRVELAQYNDVPHLLTPVVVNPKKAANALDWAVREMELRYELLHEVGVRDITGYNAAYDRGDLTRDYGDTPGPGDYGDTPGPGDDQGTPGPGDDGGTPGPGDEASSTTYERLPFILVVVDELADLMMVAARDVETSICRIAQMARAVGIHLVIATQRPSVDVITGVIKANIPSRLAFSVSSLADSRVILDAAGAEKLVGQGDMLLATASSSRAQRIQGAWVEEADVHKVVAHWKRQTTELRYVKGLAGEETESSRQGPDLDDDDDLLEEAMEMVVRSRLGSTSMLQRKLRVGFARAGRLMDLLERRGVVGPSEGSKARTVLMTVEELEALQQRS
jgi:S-DNA-T family DNA segregation ATPase FtsK/SpoIIIE